MSQTGEVLRTYRHLLRHFHRLPSAQGKQSFYSEYIHTQFRQSAAAAPQEAERKMRLASSYLELVSSSSSSSSSSSNSSSSSLFMTAPLACWLAMFAILD
jgi:hypothetical protein